MCLNGKSRQNDNPSAKLCCTCHLKQLRLEFSSLKINISPIYYTPRSRWGLLWHFLTQRATEFCKVGVYCGQGLQRKTLTQDKHNSISILLVCCRPSVPKMQQPILSWNDDIATMFFARISTVASRPRVIIMWIFWVCRGPAACKPISSELSL